MSDDNTAAGEIPPPAARRDPTDPLDSREFKQLTRDLVKLDDCDLGEWDREFIDDLMSRVEKYDRRVRLSGKQWVQLDRIKEKHL